MRGLRGHGRAHRERSGESGERGSYGPSGQQLLLSYEATAWCVGLLSVVVMELAMMSFEGGTCRADASAQCGLVSLRNTFLITQGSLTICTLNVQIREDFTLKMLTLYEHDYFRRFG